MMLTCSCEHVGKEQREWSSRYKNERSGGGQDTSISEGREDQEVSNARRFL